MSGLDGRYQRFLSDGGPVDRLRSMWSSRDQTNLYAIITMVPTIIFLIGITGMPVAYAIYLSFTNSTLFSVSNFSFVGLQNYMELFGSATFFRSIKNGIIFAIGSVSFQVVVGMSLALLLNRRFFGSSIARSLVVLTYLVPTIAAVLIWKWMLSQNSYGLVNHLLASAGLIQEPIAFFSDGTFAMLSLIVVNGWKFTSFATIIFLARLQSIDESLYEQAKISGASLFQTFRNVTLPHLRSAILLVVLLRTVWQFNKFDVVFLLTRGGPRGATTTVPVFIYEQAFFEYELALASAAAVILFLLLAVTAAIYFRTLKPSQEITSSG